MGFLMMMSFVIIMIGATSSSVCQSRVGCCLFVMKRETTFCASSANARSIAVSQS